MYKYTTVNNVQTIQKGCRQEMRNNTALECPQLQSEPQKIQNAVVKRAKV